MSVSDEYADRGNHREEDELSYTIRMGIEEPEIREIDGEVQVTENQVTGAELNQGGAEEPSDGGAQEPGRECTGQRPGRSGVQRRTPPAFVDSAGHWAEEDIDYLAEKGVVSGVDETHFEPDRAVTGRNSPRFWRNIWRCQRPGTHLIKALLMSVRTPGITAQ